MKTRSQNNAKVSKDAATAEPRNTAKSGAVSKRTPARSKKKVDEQPKVFDATTTTATRRTRRKTTGKKVAKPTPSTSLQGRGSARNASGKSKTKNPKGDSDVEESEEESEENYQHEPSASDSASTTRTPPRARKGRQTRKPVKKKAAAAIEEEEEEEKVESSESDIVEPPRPQPKPKNLPARKAKKDPFLDDEEEGEESEESEEESDENSSGSSYAPPPSSRRNSKTRQSLKAKQQLIMQDESESATGNDSDASSEPPKAAASRTRRKKQSGKGSSNATISGKQTKQIPKSKTKSTAKKRNREDYDDELVAKQSTSAKKTRRKQPSKKADTSDGNAAAAAANAMALLATSAGRASSKKRSRIEPVEAVEEEYFELVPDKLDRIVRFSTLPSTFQESNNNNKAADVAKVALALLKSDTELSKAARAEFHKEISDTDKQPVDGPGLRLSSMNSTVGSTLAILGQLKTVEKYTLFRTDELPEKYLRALTRLKIRELHLAVHEKDLEKVLKATKSTVKKLTVVVEPLNHVVVSAISTHGKKLQELALKFHGYNIYFTHTLRNIGVAAKKSLQRFDVVGKLMVGRTEKFLELDQVKNLIPSCSVSFNGKVVEEE